MSQLSIDQYFKNNKKRVGTKDSNLQPPAKLPKIDQNVDQTSTASKFEKSEAFSSSDQFYKKQIQQNAKYQEFKTSLQKFKRLEGLLRKAEGKTQLANQLDESKRVLPESSKSFPKEQSLEKLQINEPKQQKELLLVPTPVKEASNESVDSNFKDVYNEKSSLRLPYKYKAVTEIFCAVDVVSQIMYNRKETITFKKIKPAVENMCKKTFTEKHLSQICSVYPEAFKFTQEKIRDYGTSTLRQEWHLVLSPNIKNGGDMTSEVLLNRRRNLYSNLIRLTGEYHSQFLLTLMPPMTINKDKILHWHPKFEIEKLPDIQQATLPQRPQEETLTSGREVLEKARELFSFNSRVEKALTKLKKLQEETSSTEQMSVTQKPSMLKGIPKSLLEKVRQRQAAKALFTMTRSADKEKEAQMYLRLPEIARLIRNLFVTEKKNVLQLDFVVEKLQNSYDSFLTNNEVKHHLRMISEELPEWLIFNDVRELTYLKLDKNTNLNEIINKLQLKSKEKSENF